MAAASPGSSFAISCTWAPSGCTSSKCRPNRSGMSHLVEQTRRTVELSLALTPDSGRL